MAFARARKVDSSDLKAVGWFRYDFASVIIIVVPKWKAHGCNRGSGSDPLPGPVHPKVASKYYEKYRNSGMKHDIAAVVWNRLKWRVST